MYTFNREEYNKRMEWYLDARFGMFIHWGLYSIPARGEWVRSEEEIPKEDYMKYFEEFTQIEKRQGNLTNIPYEDNYFDIVYTCEALEHAIDITSAIREMVRVTRTGGKIIVIDKNKDMYGYFDIEDWEQWFDKDELKKLMMNYCTDVEYVGDIDYDNQKSNGLFGAWIGTVI